MRTRSNKLSKCKRSSSSSTYYRPNHAFVTPNLESFQLVFHQTQRSLQFWTRVLSIWSSYKLTQLNIAAQSRFRSSEWHHIVWARQHERAGQKMLNLCLDMKSFYVKAGQIIALQAFVPNVIRKKLSILHDDMPPMSPEQVLRVIEAELKQLGHTIHVFQSIDLQHVLGSASIAQVHHARLRRSNLDVAIKVQFPNMERLMMSDLANFRLLGHILQKTELKFDLIRPVEELSRQLAMEFDFKKEATHMAEIRYALRNVKQVSIPEPISGLVSRRLLVMTYLDGLPMTKLEELLGEGKKGVVRYIGRKVLMNLTACYGKMILSDGFFQADCHPGNVLILNSYLDIGLLDFGQTKRFSDDLRMSFVMLVDAMARKNPTDVIKGMERLGIKVLRKPSKKKLQKKSNHNLTFEEKLAYTMFDTASVPGVSDNPFAENSSLTDGSVENLPKDLFLLLRTMQILKGLCNKTFNSDFSVISQWSRIARAELKKSTWKP